MPNYIKALIFVLIATSIIMVVSRDPLSSHFSKRECREYRNTWWFLTVCLFLSPGIWIFYAIVLMTLLKKKYSEDIDRICVFCFLLFIAPSVPAQIPGFAGIDTFFSVDVQRLLIFFVLFPLLKSSLSGGLWRNPSDKYLLLYLTYSAVLLFRDENHTNATRVAVLMFVDFAIPYFVISRTIKSLHEFNRVLLVLMFALSLLAAEAVFEAVKHWELYNSAGHHLIGERIFKFSGERAGMLRARSIFLSPVVLGYAMVLLLALLLYLKPYFTRKSSFYCLVLVASMALLVSFSRGAWVGGVILLLVYGLIAKGVARAIWYVMAASLAGFLALNLTQFGRSILDLLPFFGGTARTDTFDYRERLLENGIVVIKRHPWFGDHYYLDSPEMEALRQGQGIIDTVNTFLTIAMYRGLIGLFLFVMIFFPSMLVIYRSNRNLPESEQMFSQLGRILISFMVAALFIISTVSNADFIPVIYTLAAAFMAAWIGIYRDNEHRVRTSSELAVRQPAQGLGNSPAD